MYQVHDDERFLILRVCRGRGAAKVVVVFFFLSSRPFSFFFRFFFPVLVCSVKQQYTRSFSSFELVSVFRRITSW